MRNPFKRFNRNGEIMVVSGLPRSGTSLMMQMLEAGGVSILSDRIRQADASNPRGYYEYEPIKRMHQGDAEWLKEAKGKAVKVISALLAYLPRDHHYRIIFMQRDINEVLRSQRKMRERLDTLDADFDPTALHREYQSHLSSILGWLEDQSNIEVVFVQHRELVTDPAPVIALLSQFLPVPLQTSAMQEVIEPSLYRERG